MTVQSTSYRLQATFRGKSSPVYPFLRATEHHEFEAGSCCCVVAAESLPPLQLILFAFHSQRVLHYSGALPSSIGFIVVIIKYPLEKCFIGRPAPDGRCIIWLPPQRTPPLTGLKACPLPAVCELLGLDFGLQALND